MNKLSLAGRLAKGLGRLLEKLLTRTTVIGVENVPLDGSTPLIFAGNHASTYDSFLLMLHVPLPVRAAGPGDFKLLFPANLLVERAGVIRIQRGAADKESLKKMTEVLKNGENLILFPDGGTWEKRLDDVKPGVVYLSHTTGARIVPVAIDGTYQVWEKIFRLKRPPIRIQFLPPLPPVQITDRKRRQEELQQASLALMQLIYTHLSPQEQARYNLHARQKFSGKLEFAPNVLESQPQSEFGVLAELISKPNLFSPLYRNLKLPLKPFVHHSRFYPAELFKSAATALLYTFTEDLKDYLPYRLGNQKSQQGLAELEELLSLSQQAVERDLAMRFTPFVEVMSDPLPPNL